MKKTLIFLSVSILILTASQFFIYSKNEGTEDVSFQHNFNSDYKIYALNKPDGINFAGELMPLAQADIYERFDRELMVNTYWQSQTLLFLKRSHKYFPIIEPILAEYGIPEDFKYLAVAESGLTNAVSPAGAKGFWQILAATAKEKGLEVNKEVDERYNLEKSTEAACKYFLKAYKEFGNWTMVAASYNMGISGLKKQIDRQKASNYYDLLLNSETARYVFRIVAVKEILNYSKRYGFNIRDKDLYTMPPTRTIMLDSTVNDFAIYAKQQGVNYKILKNYNPWLREKTLHNKKHKLYKIKLPQEGYYVSENTTQVISKKESLSIHENKLSMELQSSEENIITHTVDRKDDLVSIAAYYDVSVKDILVWNTIDENSKLKKGQKIIIKKWSN